MKKEKSDNDPLKASGKKMQLEDEDRDGLDELMGVEVIDEDGLAALRKRREADEEVNIPDELRANPALGNFVEKPRIHTRERWMKGLSHREIIFVAHYHETRILKDSVEKAGYIGPRPDNTGLRLLKKKRIQDALLALRAYSLRSLNLDLEDITRTYAQIAFSRMEDFFDDEGNVLNPKDMPNTAPIQEIKVDVTRDGTKKYTIKLADKQKALQDLAKAVGYFESHEKAKRPMNIHLNGLSIEELRKLSQMKGDDLVDLPTEE